MNMIKRTQIIVLLSLIALVGAQLVVSQMVSRDSAAKSQFVQSGVVVSVRNVTIEGDRDSGNIFGSILGAILGSNIGGEDDETTQEVGAVVGTAVGSVVGQM